MTTEERTEREKQLLLDQKRMKNELALRRDDARKIGEFLSKTGSLLSAQPERFFVAISSALHGFDARDVTDVDEIAARNALNYENVVSVSSEVRRCVRELERIEAILQTF